MEDTKTTKHSSYLENTKTTRHPAYGIARLSRCSGSPGNMFGSSVKCDNFIELAISPGEEYEHDTYHSYFSAGQPYISVYLSPAQFSELITSMNIGDGVPCTIRKINGNFVEEIPDEIHEHEIDRQKRRFRERMEKRERELRDMKSSLDVILSKKTLSKADRDELKWILEREIQEISSNIPFYMDMFDEATENVVTEAKSEIDALVQHNIINAGIKVLGEEFRNKQIESQMPATEVEDVECEEL